jgi:hypothetical protein
MISPFNFGVPSRNYLSKHESYTDDFVKKYLIEHGIKVTANKPLDVMWKKAKIDYGNIYNPSTGEMTTAYMPMLKTTLTKLFENQPQLDAIVFTNLIESRVQYKNGSTRVAEWNGVRRKVKVEGINDSITDDFNWAQIVDGISIEIYIFNREQQLIHHSAGGIQIAQALKMSSKSGQFIRRNDLLNKDAEINEGIELALHPLIPMKKYPGNIKP